ncbi:MAG TPA: alpha/beta fold hydrolase [Candidatus Binatia bacterium]|nr:alpha/beta fold hydrolase [Candidatus Binatia bacterium]
MLALKFLGVVVAVVGVAAVAFNATAYAFRCWAWTPSCEDDEPLGLLTAFAAFLVECGATMLLVLTWPFGALLDSIDGRPLHGGTPVALIHGWALNPASLWLLRRRLLQHGLGPVRIFAYASRQVDVEQAATELRDFVAAFQRECPGPLTLIGHSLGGLVARYYLRRYPAHGVRRLVTLATPHQGTLAARFGRLRRLLPNSPLIRRLNSADHVPDQFDAIAIASPFDAVIVPPTAAGWSGAGNITVRGVGHITMLLSRRIVELVVENLRVESRTA